nr:glycosyltransferase [uncultured Porphyromonas sp.]
MSEPIISVAMSCYNEPFEWLKGAIDSILNQTIQEIEFNIVIDRPDYPFERNLRSYIANDSRVNVVALNKNTGVANAKQTAIEMCNAPYIALMDADDISLENRFEVQLDFLNNNKHIDICGSWLKTFGSHEEVYKYPQKQKDFTLYLDSCIGCPTVMFRGTFLNKNPHFFNPKFRYGEDYEAWVRFFPKYRFENIPQVLLLYRISKTHVTKAKHNEMVGFISRPRLDILNYYLSKAGLPSIDAPISFKDLSIVSNAPCFPREHIGELLYRMLVSIPGLSLKDLYLQKKMGILNSLSSKHWRRLLKHLIGLKRTPYYPIL